MLKKVYRTKSNNIMPYHDHAHSLPWNVQQIIHFKASNRLIVVNVFFLIWRHNSILYRNDWLRLQMVYRIFRSQSNQIVNIRRGDEENNLWANAVVQPTTCYGL